VEKEKGTGRLNQRGEDVLLLRKRELSTIASEGEKIVNGTSRSKKKRNGEHDYHRKKEWGDAAHSYLMQEIREADDKTSPIRGEGKTGKVLTLKHETECPEASFLRREKEGAAMFPAINRLGEEKNQT